MDKIYNVEENSGTCDDLLRISYHYSTDFSDNALRQIIKIATDEKKDARIQQFLLESRKERRENKLDLGQIKIDMYQDSVTDSLYFEDKEIEIWREKDKVFVSILWFEEDGIGSATNCWDLEDFLNIPTGTLESILGETIYYNAIKEEIA